LRLNVSAGNSFLMIVSLNRAGRWDDPNQFGVESSERGLQ